MHMKSILGYENCTSSTKIGMHVSELSISVFIRKPKHKSFLIHIYNSKLSSHTIENDSRTYNFPSTESPFLELPGPE